MYIKPKKEMSQFQSTAKYRTYHHLFTPFLFECALLGFQNLHDFGARAVSTWNSRSWTFLGDFCLGRLGRRRWLALGVVSRWLASIGRLVRLGSRWLASIGRLVRLGSIGRRFLGSIGRRWLADRWCLGLLFRLNIKQKQLLKMVSNEK
jgi:hypothetical protein